MKFILLALFFCASHLLLAGGLDTLRSYDPRGRFLYYRDSTVVAQAARFNTPSPGYIREIRLLVGGRGTGRFTVHIYGAEGRSAPSVERNLIAPVTGTKQRPGVETVSIRLPEPALVDDSQFFIVVDNLNPEMQLLSDKTVHKRVCVAGSDYYYDQAVKLADGSWKWGKYGYAVDVDFETKGGALRPNLVDVTSEAHFPDSVAENRSIAWADFDGDGYLDLLYGGRLYKNAGDGTFADISGPAGISGISSANFFIDMNNDGKLDVVLLGRESAAGIVHRLFINLGNGKFAGHDIQLPGIVSPTSFSIADVDNDGYLDLFIGQNGPADSVGGRLFLNDRKLGFAADPAGYNFGRSRGSQFVDGDGDGDLDLFLADLRHPHGVLWNSTGKGGLELDDAVLPGKPAGERWLGVPAGCSWGDYDNDGDVDLLYPRKGPVLAGTAGTMAPMLFANSGDGHYDAGEDLNRAFGYEPRREGGAWGDVNNDGLLDFISTTSCECGSADLYQQVADQGFQRKTYENGLFALPAGVDAVWADYDNDGRLDLSFFINGRFHLYHNQTRTPDANQVTIDLSKLASAGEITGARVTVYAGEKRYLRDVTSGRGLLMQDPARLHFGIGAADRVDSVQVRLPGEGRSAITFAHIDPNAINYLTPSSSAGNAPAPALRIEASPNPFITELRITYNLPGNSYVLLQMFSVAGEKVATLVDAKESSGLHTVVWKASDVNGSSLPQGAYIYRLSTDHGDTDGRAVLAR